MPITNDHSMMKIFGDSKIFPGVVNVLRADLEKSIAKTKTPWRLIRESIFDNTYITNRALSGSTKAGCLVVIDSLLLTQTSLSFNCVHLIQQVDPVPTCPKPLISYIFTNYVTERAPFLAKTEGDFYKKLVYVQIINLLSCPRLSLGPVI